MFLFAIAALVLVFFVMMPGRVFAVGLAKPPNNLGLVGYFSFDDATSTVATDFSGRRNTGTLNNFNFDNTDGWPSRSTCKRSGCLQFDGSNDYVALPSALFGNYPPNSNISGYALTFATWFKTSSAGAILGQNDVATSPGGTPTGYAPALYVDTSGIIRASFFWHNNTGFQITDSSKDYRDNKWHHVADVYASGTEYLYVDGAYVGQQTYNQYGYNVGGYAYWLGTAYTGGTWSNASSGWFYWPGFLDETRIYNRALSATEISALYATGAVRRSGVNSQGLVGYWSFDDAVGTTTTDFSGNRNMGTLTNGATWLSTGKRGTAASLDGINDVVLLSRAPTTGSGSFSAFAWIKTSTTGVRQAIVNWGSNSVGNDAFYLYVGPDNKMHNDLKDNAGTISSGTVTDGRWHHVGITNTAGTFQMYVDGAASGSTVSMSPNITDNNVPNDAIGGDAVFGDYFTGSIDEVRVYNRALSASEVASLAQTGSALLNASQNARGPQSGLVALWSFDGKDVIASTVYDRSGNGSNGVLSLPQMSTGVMGQALGYGNGVSIPTYSGPTLGSSSDFTISAWFKPSDVTSPQYLYDGLKSGGSGDNNPAIILGYQSGYFNIFIDGYAGGNANNTKVPATANEWQHLVYTSDGSSVKGYINGVLSVNWSGSFRLNGNLTGVNIVGLPTDDVRVYNRVLSATEVAQLYRLGVGAVQQ